MRIKNFLMYSIMTQLGKKKSHGSSFLKDLGSVGDRMTKYGGSAATIGGGMAATGILAPEGAVLAGVGAGVAGVGAVASGISDLFG